LNILERKSRGGLVFEVRERKRRVEGKTHLIDQATRPSSKHFVKKAVGVRQTDWERVERRSRGELGLKGTKRKGKKSERKDWKLDSPTRSLGFESRMSAGKHGEGDD